MLVLKANRSHIYPIKDFLSRKENSSRKKNLCLGTSKLSIFSFNFIFLCRGPFITALGKTWCPNHFVCSMDSCRQSLQDVGFVEEKSKEIKMGKLWSRCIFHNQVSSIVRSVMVATWLQTARSAGEKSSGWVKNL